MFSISRIYICRNTMNIHITVMIVDINIIISMTITTIVSVGITIISITIITTVFNSY